MNKWIEFTGKTVEEATENAIKDLDSTIDKLEIEVVEKETKGLLGMFSKPAVIKVKKILSVEDTAKDFLMKIFKTMDLNAECDVKYDEEDKTIDIDLSGDEMGVLIGKRGQTLDSLQYLTSLVINKESESYIKVKIDTENYRQRRKETLENLAKNISHKVKRTRKAVTLEPMNPYERRIIHSTLQNDKFVETHSEGEEPFRKVVVTPKKDLKEYDNNRRGSRYRNNRYSNKYDSVSDYKKKFNENYKKSYQSITLDDVNKDETSDDNQ